MRLRVDPAEAGAFVADLGTLLPILAALVVTNNVDAVPALAIAGALSVAAGLVYRVPVPVQPIKAAAAIAIATRAPPEVIAAAGLLLGAILVVLAVTRAAGLLLRLFPKPVIRGNQLGVGALLCVAAVKLARTGTDDTALVVGGVLVLVLFATERARRFPAALALVAGGIVWSLAHGADPGLSLRFELPAFAPPGWAATATALTLLVIPQIPLTLGNAIVGTAALEREYYGERARRVTPRALCVTSGAANLAAGLLGGMPLCHGSSGATAYHRFGARTGGVNLVLGGALIAAGILFGRAAIGVFALIPPAVLGALLAYTGLRHALLVTDLRGWPLGVAVAMGAVGAATRNLTYGMAVGFPMVVAGALRARGNARGPR